MLCLKHVKYLSLFGTGSLIKLLYFSRHEEDYSNDDDKRKRTIKERLGITNGNLRSYPVLGGRLHFVKFETHKINECLDFIHSKQLHRRGIFAFFSSHPTNLCTRMTCYQKIMLNQLLFESMNLDPYPWSSKTLPLGTGVIKVMSF